MGVKPASHCPIWKSLMALVLTNIIGCDSCLPRSHPVFRSHCPTDQIRFLLCLSHNAFLTMIEMNNRMRSIRSSLTCQSPSDSIWFFKIASDRLIVSDFPCDFPSDPSNHQIIWQWDAGLRNKLRALVKVVCDPNLHNTLESLLRGHLDPSGKTTSQCKFKHESIDFYP